MGTEPRKLISIAIENFKRLEVAYLEFPDGVTEITGANGNGKSSVLDAITALLTGKGGVPPDAIHHGKEFARIQGSLGDLIVTLDVTKGANGKQETKLKVESTDGARYGSPQAILDEIYAQFRG